MNLVAKEYVACHPDGDGVLVLSEFAGAARELGQAILVNPYEPESICRSIETAVQMSTAERAHRIRALHRTVSVNDIRWWTNTFLDMIETVPATPVLLAAQS
jgi:trehalose 6-phosphate synthase/phosphatase